MHILYVMSRTNEIKTVFIGDIAFNTDITPAGTRTSIGGAAYYSAVGATAAMELIREKPRTGVVAPVGGDFDISYLLEKGIDIAGVPIIPDDKTCHFILTQHPDNTRDFLAERNVASLVNPNIFPKKYASARHIHLATSLPQNYITWINSLMGKTSALISSDAFEAFAIEYPQETIQALNMSHMIFINEAEANILERHGTIRTDVPWILKKGAGGASYISESKEIRVPTKRVDAIETTGAGDVLAGAFLALLAEDYQPEQALKCATNIASLSVTQFGVEHLLG